MPETRPVRRLVASALFPVTLAGTVWTCIALIQAGVDATLAYVVLIPPTYLIVIALERWLPLHADWSRSHGDVGPDLLFAASSGVTVFGTQALVFVGLIEIGGLAERGGVAWDVWPHAWPLWLQLALALVAGELGQYWAHRLSHEWPWLWRFHSVHHGARRLYFLNAARFHPIDLAITTVAWFPFLVLLGCSPEVFALFGLVSFVHGLFQHCNIPMRIGPLNWIFSMAELHRWHHSRLLDEANTNYGQQLIVWDVVFGTRFLPADREPPAQIGIADMPAFPRGFVRQLAVPFTWARTQRESGTAGGVT